MLKKVDASKINVDFGKNDELKDEYLLSLLEKAYKKEIKCRIALIKMEAIEPKTSYEPEVSREFRRHFFEKLTEGESIPIFVYWKDEKFIMSDDYNSFSLYKEILAESVPCVVVGEIIDEKDVIEVGEPFNLEAPRVDVIN